MVDESPKRAAQISLASLLTFILTVISLVAVLARTLAHAAHTSVLAGVLARDQVGRC